MTDEKKKRYLCPECGNTVVKAGRVTINRSGRKKQQWKCMICGRRTLKPLKKKSNLDSLRPTTLSPAEKLS